MDERGEITVTEEDSEGIELAIKGDGSGLLIGRHGQTLDSLEYLVNRILARRVKDAVPIMVDTESLPRAPPAPTSSDGALDG